MRVNKKINNKMIAILLSLGMVFAFNFVANARVIYKDINSISIRTNFDFDFDSMSENGLPDINAGSADGESGDFNVYVSSTAKYEIESAEWYSQGDRDFEIGGSPRVVVYLTTKDYDEYNNYVNNYYFYGPKNIFGNPINELYTLKRAKQILEELSPDKTFILIDSNKTITSQYLNSSSEILSKDNEV